MRKLVGRNFARLREQKKLSQEQLEECSGFSQQYLSGLENGKRNPTIVTLFELALALGVSHVELVAPDDEALTSVAKRKASARRSKQPPNKRK